MNKVCLVGRLARDPFELRRSNLTAVINFTVAVDNNRSKKEDENSADYIPCVAFNKTAEFVEAYVKQGMLVSVEGRLTSSIFEKDGKKTSKVEVTVDNIQLLESKGYREYVSQNRSEGGYQPETKNNPTQTYQPSPKKETNIGVDVDDSDLGFM